MQNKQLSQLIFAWEQDEPGSAQALHDALEELNFPWEWRPSINVGKYHLLFLADFPNSGEQVIDLDTDRRTYSMYTPGRGWPHRDLGNRSIPIPKEVGEALDALKHYTEEQFKKYLREHST